MWRGLGRADCEVEGSEKGSSTELDGDCFPLLLGEKSLSGERGRVMAANENFSRNWTSGVLVREI
jgi:hypothetical protein